MAATPPATSSDGKVDSTSLPAETSQYLECPHEGGVHKVHVRVYQGTRDIPVVMVHGLTRNSGDFVSLALTLQAQGYSCYAIDVVGRGLSDYLDNKALYGYPLYVADCMSVIRQLGLKKVHWVGTSMGGLIGMILGSVPVPVRGFEFGCFVFNDVGPFIPKEPLEFIATYAPIQHYFDSVEEAATYLSTAHATFGPLTPAQWHNMAQYSTHRVDADINGTIVSKLTLRYDVGIASSFKPGAMVDVNMWPVFALLKADNVLVLRGETSILLPADVAAEMIEAKRPAEVPRAKLVLVPLTGHAPALLDTHTQSAILGAIQEAETAC